MRILYNTGDIIFTDAEVRNAFIHAYFVGKSEWRGDPDLAFREWRDEYMKNTQKAITLEAITDAVLDVMNHTYYDVIIDYRRFGKYPLSRQLICYFGWVYTTMGVEKIARHMKYDNHATVIHGRRKINDDIRLGNKEVIEKVDAVKLYLHKKGYALTHVKRLKEEVCYV